MDQRRVGDWKRSISVGNARFRLETLDFGRKRSFSAGNARMRNMTGRDSDGVLGFQVLRPIGSAPWKVGYGTEEEVPP
eukprot:227104-Rhodomonas_salina.6